VKKEMSNLLHRHQQRADAPAGWAYGGVVI
jgi:hypothetical protein